MSWVKYRKVKTFSVPVKKKVVQDLFIDSARFMETSLSNLVDNLTEGIDKRKCKECDCLLKYESVRDNLIKYKYLSCNNNYSNKTDEELKKRFKNTFKFFW